MESSLTRVWTVFLRATASAPRINSSNSWDDGSLEKRLSIDLVDDAEELAVAEEIAAEVAWWVSAAEPELAVRLKISADGNVLGYPDDPDDDPDPDACELWYSATAKTSKMVNNNCTFILVKKIMYDVYPKLFPFYWYIYWIWNIIHL